MKDQRPETVAVILAAANRLHLVDDPDVDRRIGHAGYARNRRRRRPAPSPRNGDQSDGFEGDGAELQPSRPAGPDRHSRLAHPNRIEYWGLKRRLNHLDTFVVLVRPPSR